MFYGKPSILIVDDDATILQGLGKIFRKKGFRVTTVEDGKEAMKKIGANRFDVALIDMALADMEGDKLLPIISNSSPKTLKIMLTGRVELQGCVRDVDLFVGKPVAPETLLSLINGKLRYRRAHKN